LRRLTNNHYQSYATALTITIAVGCFLLLLNVFIFAAIYYQREKRASYTKKKEELTEAENLNSSSPSIERFQQKGSRKSSLQSVSGNGFGEYSCYEEKIRCKEKRALVDLCTVELPLQEFKCSPPCSSTSGSVRRSITPENFKHNPSPQENLILLPPSYLSHSSTINESKFDATTNNLITYRSIIIPKEQCNQATQSDSPPTTQDVSTTIAEDDQELSPDIPEPPPPPRASFQGGILRQGNGPTTPGTTKKRVQIQEISV
jgi:neuroligin